MPEHEPEQWPGRGVPQGAQTETIMIKAILWIVGIFALIGLLVVGGCFKLIF